MKTLIKILCLSVLWFSCEESPTEPQDEHGCLDSQACNYNPNATIDNNSCLYENSWCDCEEGGYTGGCNVDFDTVWCNWSSYSNGPSAEDCSIDFTWFQDDNCYVVMAGGGGTCSPDCYGEWSVYLYCNSCYDDEPLDCID